MGGETRKSKTTNPADWSPGLHGTLITTTVSGARHKGSLTSRPECQTVIQQRRSLTTAHPCSSDWHKTDRTSGARCTAPHAQGAPATPVSPMGNVRVPPEMTLCHGRDVEIDTIVIITVVPPILPVTGCKSAHCAVVTRYHPKFHCRSASLRNVPRPSVLRST